MSLNRIYPLVFALSLATGSKAEIVTLVASADTGLFEFAPENNLGNSTALQIGTNGQGTVGRGLFRFDLAAGVPPGARIDSATVTFGVTAAAIEATPIAHALHRVQLEWYEGNGSGGQGAAASQGEATWDARLHGLDQWTTPGGSPGTDFVSSASATTDFSDAGTYAFDSTQRLIDDVQSWLDDPSCNFGWVLISTDEGTRSSTRRIASRESETLQPQLRIEFTPLRITGLEANDDLVTIDWQGGKPPFSIERSPSLRSDWTEVGATDSPPFEFSKPEGRSFMRVRSAVPGETARYRLTWKATWSNTTHPTNFPGGAHFSDLYGATHNSGITFWEPGGLATTGIKNMAERGSNTALRNEIQAAIGSGSAETLVDGFSIQSPGQTSVTFDVSQSHPLATFVCMIAPSPDWFVGVHGLPLFENGAWVAKKTVALQAYDAGTDSGTNYTSSNLATNPAEPITQIDLRGETRPLGTFTFERIE